MTALVLLSILVVLDGAGSSFRAAAGRSALIDKRRWYARALLRGALYGAVVVAAGFAAGAIEGRSFFDRGEALARAALYVYVPAGVPVLALALLRVVRNVDFRSLSSTLIFGPLSLARTFIIVMGAVPAFAAGRPYTVFAAGIAGAMLAADRILPRLTPAPPEGRAGETRA
jgi:hypothetical protein